MTRLRAAGDALAAGRDLLRTHAGSGAGGEWVEHSEWAAVIRSAPVNRAVVEEVGRWSQEIAFLAARLSLVSPMDAPVPVTVRHGLASSCHWLLAASGALTAGQRADPATASDLRLLAAIPVNHLLARRAPADCESFAALAEHLTDSAARLRALTRVTPGQGVWSPAMTADSWRWTAGAAAAICHLSRQALGTLAGHPVIVDGSEAGRRLAAAAESLAQACERWRDVGRAWRSMTTEADGLTGPGLADTSDLAVRLGRILLRDPAWTPERKNSSAPPRRAELAPNGEAFAMVVGAVHHAVDALAHVAAADREAVGLAIRASRLHMPTRMLPSVYNVPYRFGPAPPAKTAALRVAYQDACDATGNAVTAVDALAVAVEAPSQVLADARAARRSLAARDSVREEPQGDDARRRDSSHAGRLAVERPCGPVELAMRALDPPDPSLLLRAQAVDKAAIEVTRQARASAERDRREAVTRKAELRRSADPPSRSAAASFPGQAKGATGGGRATS